MKKSVSSSPARSGDVDPEVSEGATLGDQPISRARAIFVAGDASGSVGRFEVLLGFLYG
jgi:hypothetical protein